MIQYQGEPLAKLQAIGFNTVYLANPPSRQILQEALQVGIWLVCPPPFGVST